MAGTAVVVLTVDAAAGRELLIYLCSAADRLEEAVFRIFFQPFSVAQTAPFMGQPFRLSSAPHRYNTLDFPAENRVPRVTLSPLDTPAKGNAVSLWIPYANRMLLAPIGCPRAKSGRCPPLETSLIFYDCEYPNCKNTVCYPYSLKIHMALS